jgi:hypothetical protein
VLFRPLPEDLEDLEELAELDAEPAELDDLLAADLPDPLELVLLLWLVVACAEPGRV